jgi:hypothetical protein
LAVATGSLEGKIDNGGGEGVPPPTEFTVKINL